MSPVAAAAAKILAEAGAAVIAEATPIVASAAASAVAGAAARMGAGLGATVISGAVAESAATLAFPTIAGAIMADLIPEAGDAQGDAFSSLSGVDSLVSTALSTADLAYEVTSPDVELKPGFKEPLRSAINSVRRRLGLSWRDMYALYSVFQYDETLQHLAREEGGGG